MKNTEKLTLVYIKSLGKNKTSEEFDELLSYFNQDLEMDLKREIVSSIGRQTDLDKIFDFLNREAFNNHPMELVYQMYRTCLYKGKKDARFIELGEKIKNFYHNENINKMFSYYKYKQERICI